MKEKIPLLVFFVLQFCIVQRFTDAKIPNALQELEEGKGTKNYFEGKNKNIF